MNLQTWIEIGTIAGDLVVEVTAANELVKLFDPDLPLQIALLVPAARWLLQGQRGHADA